MSEDIERPDDAGLVRGLAEPRPLVICSLDY